MSPKKSEMPEPKTKVEQQLERILEILEHMNRRDRARTIGGFFKSVISLIPVFILLWSVWYVFEHGDELLSQLTSKSAEAVQNSMEGSTQNIMKQFEGMVR